MSGAISSIGSVLSSPVGQLAGNLLGGYLGRKDRPQEVGQQIITNDPPAYAKENLETVANEAKALYNRPRTFYPDQTYLPFNQQARDALTLGEARARAGGGMMPIARDNFRDVLKGNFLSGGNPFFNQAVQQAMDPVEARVNSVFSRAGRLGSGANQEVLAKSLADAALNVRMDDYNRERSAQLDAIPMAPAIDAIDYADIAQLAAIGETLDAKDMQGLQESIARHQFEQEEPWKNISRLSSATIGGIPAGTGQTATPMYQSPAASFYAGSQMFGDALGKGFNFLGGRMSDWSAPTTVPRQIGEYPIF